MNVPGFNAEASIYRGQSYRSPRLSHGVPGRVVLQAPAPPGFGTGSGGSSGSTPGPAWPQSGPCECWKQCMKNKTVFGQANCNRLFHLAKCLNEENDFANCYGLAEDQWSKPPFWCKT
jgi:hypothetical protein